MQKRNLLMILTLLFVCACLSGCFGGIFPKPNPTPEATHAEPTPTPGMPKVSPKATEPPAQTAFDFDTVDLEGNALNTREFAAEHDLTLVNFWATWCGPCVNEMPGLQSLHERFSAGGEGADVAILGIWLDTESPDDMQAVLDYTGAAYQMVEFRDAMASAVALQYIPATVFLDASGNIVGDPIVGAKDEDGWLSEIEARLTVLGLS